MKNLLKNLLLIVSVVFTNNLYAQFGPPQGGGGDGNGRPRSTGNMPSAVDIESNIPKGNSKISGVVLDDNGKDEVEYANIALVNAATKKVVDGTMADEKGVFSMKKVAAGVYNVTVSFIGYSPKTIEKVKIEKGKDVDLGTIKLSQNTQTLKEVTVTGQAALIEEKVDRLVYNAEKDLSSKGGDASDVLKNVPMLSVDLDGNVSLRGSQNIKVLINNKPSTIVASSIADALKMIPADLIKNVEVITSPSAKYDAEGAAGIINIITKKSNLEGLNLNIDAGVGLRSSNIGLNGNYRKGKLGISLGGFGRALYNRAGSVNDQTLKLSGVNTVQTANEYHTGMFGRYNLGMDYDIDKNQSITGSLAFGTRIFNNNRDQNTTISNRMDSVMNQNYKNIFTKDQQLSVDANLDYIHKFEKGKEWSVSAQSSQSFLNTNLDAKTETLLSPYSVLSTQNNLNKGTNRENTLQTDYVNPIGANQQFEVGVKSIWREVNSNYTYNTTPTNLSTITTNGLLNYKQNILAGYFSYMYTTANKITIKAGTRYEHTNINAESGTGNILIPAYSNIVPSINISKKVNNATVKLAYNKRIQRPGMQQLNPNVNMTNTQNISYGNPSLKPELTDNVEFSISGNVKKSYLTLAVFGRQTLNSIVQFAVPNDTLAGGIKTTFVNAGKDQTVGTNLYGNMIINQNWTVSGGVDVYYRSLMGTAIGAEGITKDISNQGWVVGGRLMTSYKLKNGWQLQANGGMRGKNVNLQGYQGPMGMYSVSVRKDFANKKGSIGFGADNFINGMHMKSVMNSDLLNSYTRMNMYNTNFKVTLSLKIGNMKMVAVKDSKKIKNTDVKEGSDNNN